MAVVLPLNVSPSGGFQAMIGAHNEQHADINSFDVAHMSG
jgi:hypothetical protein